MAKCYVTVDLILFSLYISEALTVCNYDNFPKEPYKIKEDSPIGLRRNIWETDTNPSWKVVQPNDSFVTVYFVVQENTVALELNVTGDTDVDSDCSKQHSVNMNITCEASSESIVVSIKPQNDNPPRLDNSQNLRKSIKEDFPIYISVEEFGTRFKDIDCPRQNITFSLKQSGYASGDKYLDGTQYFDIYENGTLYLKEELDYETSICGVRSDAKLFFVVLAKDSGLPSQNETYNMELTLINVDDAPPKFIDVTADCTTQCKFCEISSFSGNISYENQGMVTVNPMIYAIDVENTSSTMEYFITGAEPGGFLTIFNIDDTGTVSLHDSFQNATNDTATDDFTVLVYIQAMSSRTSLETMNVTLNLTVEVPPETTTFQTTTIELTTTNKETTAEETTTVGTTSTPVQTTPPRMIQNEQDDNNVDVVVIVVPITVVVLLIIIAIVIYNQRKSHIMKKYKYRMESEKYAPNDYKNVVPEPKHANVDTNAVPVDKLELQHANVDTKMQDQ